MADLCPDCGHALPNSVPVNYCNNCGHPINDQPVERRDRTDEAIEAREALRRRMEGNQ